MKLLAHVRRYWVARGPWDGWIVAVALAVVALVWAATFERIEHERDEVLRDAEKQNSNLSLALQEHTVRTLKSVDQGLSHLARTYRSEGAGLNVQALIDTGEIDLELLHDFGVTDDKGIVMVSRSSSDKHYGEARQFREHRRRPDLDMLVGAPTKGMPTGKWVLPVTKRINRPDGSFGGITYAGLNPNYFTRLYRLADLGHQGVILLVGLDGVVRARRVGESETFGRDLSGTPLMTRQRQQSEGTFTDHVVDGVERIYSYRRLAGYPLVVAVGTSRDEVLAAFVKRSRNYDTGAIAATVLVLALTVAVLTTLTRQRLAMNDLALQRTVQATMQQTLLDALLLVDQNGRIVSTNHKFAELWGVPEELVRQGDDSAVLEFETNQVEDSEAFFAKVVHLSEHKDETSQDEFRFRDGRTIDRYSAPVVGPDGAYYGRLWLFRDITRRKHDEEQRRLSAQAFESIADGVLVIDAQRRIVSVNKAYCAISGYTADEVIGKTPRLFRSNHHDAAFYDGIWDDLNQVGFWRGEVWARRRDGENFPELLSVSAVKDDQGATTHFVGVCTDISDVKRYEAQLEHQATHDALTELPNRVLFENRFGKALSRARRSGSRAAVLFIDLDRFKSVNDTLGHAAGDILLQEAARRLSASVRRSDTVARFGGDEFAILLEAVSDPEAEVVARKVLDAMSAPFNVAGHDLFVSASVGISFYPEDGADPATLLKNADAALYRAKKDGRNQFCLFSVDMNARALDNLVMTNALRLALERGELVLHYQPCVDLRSGQISSVEALARWNHPELGLLPPARFIALAEESGLVEPIGEHMLAMACRQMREWRDAGLTVSKVAVNLSTRQFRVDLPQRIAGILRASGLPGHHLELEVTESVMMQDPEAAATILTQLKSLGVWVAIDDFGTGYSSLSYLKSLPIDFLKIDRSFVHGVPDAADDAAIIRAIIAMAKSLGLSLIAEGVETDQQRAFLAEHGCHTAQGWYFSKALPSAEITALLTEDRRRWGKTTVASPDRSQPA